MVTESLLSCTIKFLELLFRQFDDNHICFDDLLSYSQLKLRFIADNMDAITGYDEKLQVEKLFGTYSQILSSRNYQQHSGTLH